ncbi:SdpI family protein [bacterium]|nr:SdpI family protein [Methanomicrobia archaeon]MCD6148272.1 SdpI family protein [bacterium]
MRKGEKIALSIIVLSFIIAVCSYPYMPEKMAIHWNAKGNVDSYGSRFEGLFFLPFLLAGLFLLFMAIPKIDPMKYNIEDFRKYYDNFIVLFFIFLLSVYLWSILWNFGVEIRINAVIPVGVGILFFYVGILLENAKRNWFIGIRTPWTLSSEDVWNRTHKIGGKLFKVLGLVVIFGIFFQKYVLFFFLVPLLLVAGYLVVYSYFEYQKEIQK